MPKPTLWKDEYTLLCERCGYVIEGLDLAGSCPECGKPIAESLPDRRIGTPAQLSAGTMNWLATARVTLFTPRRTFEQIRFDGTASRRVLARNLFLSGFVTSIFLLWTLSLRPKPNDIAEVATIVVVLTAVALPLSIGGALFFGALTWIETRGVMFFSARRGWRVDGVIAEAICAHAAFAWWIAGAGLALGLASTRRLEPLLWKSLAGTPLGWFIPAIPPLVGFALGLMVFETLVYKGVRICKFANRPRPVDAS